MADKELTAAEKREALIRQKMRDGNMTRENAELVVDHQEAADAALEKKTKKAAKGDQEKGGQAK